MLLTIYLIIKESFLPEPYNPEAPGIERPLRMPAPPFWSAPPPPSISNTLNVSRNSRPRGNAPYMPQVQQPQRTLIGIPVVENIQGKINVIFWNHIKSK